MAGKSGRFSTNPSSATFMESEPAVKLFEKYRFRHSRSRTVSGKELMYFYLDLYTSRVKKDE